MNMSLIRGLPRDLNVLQPRRYADADESSHQQAGQDRSSQSAPSVARAAKALRIRDNGFVEPVGTEQDNQAPDNSDPLQTPGSSLSSSHQGPELERERNSLPHS